MLTTLVLAFLTSFPQPSFAQEKPAATHSAPLAAERIELAEIQLLLGADRKYAEAKERLATLKETLAKRSDADAKDLLAQVERLDQTVRRALGEAVPAAANTGADKVDEAVLAAIAREDFAFVSQLGKRAVPGLVRAVRENADVFPSDEGKDPLSVLCNIDPLATSQLAGELLNENGFFWKKRVARLLDSDLLTQPGLWTSGSPQRWLGDGLSKTAERFVDDADVGLRALRFLAELIQRGGSSTVFEPALGRALRDEDGARRKDAMSLSLQYAPRVGVATYRAMLDEPDAGLREHAADVLLRQFRADRSLLARAQDSSANVRSHVVAVLRNTGQDGWHDEERQILTRLLADEDKEVRKQAREVLWSLPSERRDVSIDPQERMNENWKTYVRRSFLAPLPDEVYRGLAKGDPSERVELSSFLCWLPAPLCFELLAVLAAEPDSAIVADVAEHLGGAPLIEDPNGALHVADILLASSNLTNRDKVVDALSGLWATRTTTRALRDWLLERGDDALVSQLFKGRAGMLVRMSRLEPERFTAFLARYFEACTPQLLQSNDGQDLYGSPELASAFLELAKDAKAPLLLRVIALRQALVKTNADERHRAAGLELLKSPAWRDWESSQPSADMLTQVLRGHPTGLANALILQALRDPALPQEFPAQLADELAPNEDGAAEIVPLVLAHWPGAEFWFQPVIKMLDAMGSVPALQDPAFLARAVQDPRIDRQTFGTLARLSDPRYLPLLADIVAKPANQQQLKSAAFALSGYLDEGAVEPLLAAAAKVQDADTRDACLAHLEKIREYQDSKERWATRKVKAQTREQVIAELVAQLAAKSDDVKVQAIRALATWDAVETMPKLIELTSSGSKSVAAAAREALERLNAPKKD